MEFPAEQWEEEREQGGGEEEEREEEEEERGEEEEREEEDEEEFTGWLTESKKQKKNGLCVWFVGLLVDWFFSR